MGDLRLTRVNALDEDGRFFPTAESVGDRGGKYSDSRHEQVSEKTLITSQKRVAHHEFRFHGWVCDKEASLR